VLATNQHIEAHDKAIGFLDGLNFQFESPEFPGFKHWLVRHPGYGAGPHWNQYVFAWASMSTNFLHPFTSFGSWLHDLHNFQHVTDDHVHTLSSLSFLGLLRPLHGLGFWNRPMSCKDYNRALLDFSEKKLLLLVMARPWQSLLIKWSQTALNGMTHVQILALVLFFNDDFGTGHILHLCLDEWSLEISA